MATDLLLDSIERGAVDFDEMLPESLQAWTYFTDEPYRLCRFATDDDPERDPSAVGWIWRAHEDTWHVWPRGNFEVFEPGVSYWEHCLDVDVAKAAIRAWLATFESA